MLPLREPRSCSCVAHDGSEAWHGKTTGYYKHRCGCEKCVGRMRDYSRQRYVSNRKAHLESMRLYRLANRDAIVIREWDARRKNRQAIRLREERRTEAMRELDALADRKHRRWTAEEDEMVLRTDLRVVDIAAELGRTFRAVKARRALLRRKPQEDTPHKPL